MSDANVARNVRRRLRGKSHVPMTTMAIAIPIKPTAKSGNARGRFCHYAALEIEKTASAEQVRQAYRKRAMQLHPDKLVSHLGRPPTADEVANSEDDYCRIVTAFDILSDEVLRREYDDLIEDVELESKNEVEAQIPCPQAAAPIDPIAHARQEARLIMHACLFEDRKFVVAELDTKVLVALRSFLRGDKPAHARFTRKSIKKGSNKLLDSCMSFKASYGYMVDMTFANFNTITGFTWSLEHAFAWRAALTVLRSNVQAKLRKFECTGEATDAEMRKILSEEVREALRIEPDMTVKFRFRISKLSTPLTENIYLAISDKVLFTKARKDSKAKFNKVSSAAKKAATKHKQECRSRCALLLAAVVEEVEYRMEHTVRQVQATEEDDQASVLAELLNENQVLQNQLDAERAWRRECRVCSAAGCTAPSQHE